MPLTCQTYLELPDLHDNFLLPSNALFRSHSFLVRPHKVFFCFSFNFYLSLSFIRNNNGTFC